MMQERNNPSTEKEVCLNAFVYEHLMYFFFLPLVIPYAPVRVIVLHYYCTMYGAIFFPHSVQGLKSFLYKRKLEHSTLPRTPEDTRSSLCSLASHKITHTHV